MQWDDGIEGPHRDIAGSKSSRIGVLAGPGTGKTSFGLMRRVVRLLEEGVPGERILLISFTRVAAADLRDKVGNLDAPGVEDVKAMTLHGYCFGLLQRDSVLAITGRHPRVLLDHEVDLMLRDIGGDFGNLHERRRRLEAYVAGWARNIGEHPGLATDGDDLAFQQAVDRWLREHGAMLIGEVVPQAYKYLSQNPAADEMGAFDHVVVDEYQDLNALEQSLLDVLAADASLCIAGDDDQSIYSVRYANPDGIHEFMDRAEVEEYSIDVCGRCPSTILAMANSIIGQAPGRADRELTPRDESEPGVVNIVQWSDIQAEADGIASAIAQDVASGRLDPGEILVLTNWRKVGEAIRQRLKEVDIPVRSFFTEEELSSDEAKTALALLRLVADENDMPAMRVLLSLGDGTGRTAAYQRLLGHCRANGETPTQALSRLHGEEKITGLNVPALVQRFGNAMSRVEQLMGLELAELVDALFPEDQDETADLREAALDALADAKSVDELLGKVVGAITQDDVPQSPDFVRVMSLHKSKGLTSTSVYVAGAIHGVLPTLVSNDPEEDALAMMEGRRLFYVAVTRAASELTISSVKSVDLADASKRRVRYDKSTIHKEGGRLVVKAIASPYLAELGPAAPAPVRGERWLGDR